MQTPKICAQAISASTMGLELTVRGVESHERQGVVKSNVGQNPIERFDVITVGNNWTNGKCNLLLFENAQQS